MLFQQKQVRNNGRDCERLVPTNSRCPFKIAVNKLKEGHKFLFQDDYFDIVIDEHGNILPCCTIESAIGGIPPYANIFKHDFKEVIYRALYYDLVLDSLHFKYADKPEYYESCSLCGNELKNFITEPFKYYVQ